MANNLTAQVVLAKPTSSNFSDVIGAIRNNFKQVENIKVKIELDQSSLAGLATLSKTIQNSLTGISTQANNASSSLSKLQTSISSANNASATLAKRQDDLKSTLKKTAEAGKEAGDVFEKFGETAGLAARRFLGFSIAAGSVIAVIAAFKEGIGQALEFQKQLVKLEQVGVSSSKELGELSSEVTKLSTTLGVSSKELIGVANTLKQAGFSARDTKILLEGIAQTSLAPSFKDMADTTETAIAALKQFNIEASKFQGVLGSINAVSNEFAVEAQDIGVAIRVAGGAFKAAGGDLDQLIAAFTSVRATTRESAESIATGIRTISTRIQRPEVIDSLKELGVNLRFSKEEAIQLGNVDLERQFVGPYEAIQRLNVALKGLNTTDPRFAQVTEELGGYRQISKVIPLLQQQELQQRALNTAQAGSISLTISSEQAQKSFLQQLSKVKEEFLATFRLIQNSESFKFLGEGVLFLARGLNQVLQILEKLQPLLLSLAAIKLGQSIFGVGTGLNSVASGFGKAFTQSSSLGIARATGGTIPGTGNSDSVHAMLTPGEFVIKKSSVTRIGRGKLELANATGELPKFAGGGSVERLPGESDEDYRKRTGRFVGRVIPDYLQNKGPGGRFVKPFLPPGTFPEGRDLDTPYLVGQQPEQKSLILPPRSGLPLNIPKSAPLFIPSPAAPAPLITQQSTFGSSIIPSRVPSNTTAYDSDFYNTTISSTSGAIGNAGLSGVAYNKSSNIVNPTLTTQQSTTTPFSSGAQSPFFPRGSQSSLSDRSVGRGFTPNLQYTQDGGYDLHQGKFDDNDRSLVKKLGQKEPRAQTAFEQKVGNLDQTKVLLAGLGLNYGAELLGGKGSALSGATTGATSGFSAGLLVGPITAIIGGLVGGLSGLVIAINKTSDDIKKAKIDKEMETFSKTLKDVNEGIVSTGSASGSLIQNINARRGEAIATSRSESTSFFGKGNDDLFKQRLQINTGTRFTNDLPAIFNLLDKSIRDLAQKQSGSFRGLSGSALEDQFDNLQKTFIAGNDGLNQQFLRLIAEAKNISLREAAEEFRKAAEEGVRAGNLASLEAKQREFGIRQTASLGRISAITENAGNAALKSGAINRGIDVFGGNQGISSLYSNQSALSNTTSDTFINSLEQITNSFGNNAEDIRDTGIAYKQIFSEIGPILQEVGKSGGFGSKNIGQTVEAQIRARLGVKDGEGTAEFRKILSEAITNIQHSSETNPKQFKEGVSFDIDKYLADIIIPSFKNFSNVLEASSKNINDALNRLADGLNENQQRINRITNERFELSRINLESQKFDADLAARAAGQPGNGVNFLPLSQLQRPFNERQTNLAGVNAFNPAGISQRLSDIDKQIPDLERQRIEGKSNEERERASQELSKLTGEAGRLGQALRNLADPSQRLVGVFEKLNASRQESDNIVEFAKNIYGASPRERGRLAAGLDVGQLALEKGVGGLNQSQIQLMISELSKITVRSDALGGKTGPEALKEIFSKDLLGPNSKFAFAQEKVKQGRLENDTQKVNNEAKAAQEAIITREEQSRQTFYTSLENIFKNFVNDLSKGDAERRGKEIASRQGEAGTKLFDLQKQEQAKNTLNGLGIDGKQGQSIVDKLTRRGDADKILDSAVKESRITGDLLKSGNKINEVISQDNLGQDKGSIFNPKAFDSLIETVNKISPGLIDVLDKEKLEGQFKEKATRFQPSLADTGEGSSINKLDKGEQAKLLQSLINDIISKKIQESVGREKTVRDEFTKENPSVKIPETIQGMQQLADAVNVFKANPQAFSSANTELKKVQENFDDLTKKLADVNKEIQAITGRTIEIRSGKTQSQLSEDEFFNGGSAIGLANGGNVFQARGSDTVPAMLTPGEFVVNAGAAQQHAGLLDFINGGGTMYLAGGGSVEDKKYNNYLRKLQKEVERVAPYGSISKDAKAAEAKYKSGQIDQETYFKGIKNYRPVDISDLEQSKDPQFQNFFARQRQLTANTKFSAPLPLADVLENKVNSKFNQFAGAYRRFDNDRTKRSIEDTFGNYSRNFKVDNNPFDGPSPLKKSDFNVIGSGGFKGDFQDFQKRQEANAFKEFGKGGDNEFERFIGNRTRIDPQNPVGTGSTAFVPGRSPSFNKSGEGGIQLESRAAFGSRRGIDNASFNSVFSNNDSTKDFNRFSNNQAAGFKKIFGFSGGGKVPHSGTQYLARGGNVNSGGANIDTSSLVSFGASFSSSTSSFSSAVLSFAQSSNSLSQAISNFPSSISGSFTHNVNVVLNGAEALASMAPEIEKLVVNTAKSVLNKYIGDNIPDAGRIYE